MARAPKSQKRVNTASAKSAMYSAFSQSRRKTLDTGWSSHVVRFSVITLLTTTSLVAYRISRIAYRISLIAYRRGYMASRFTLHVSRFTLHVPRFAFHASRFTPHVHCLCHSVSDCVGTGLLSTLSRYSAHLSQASGFSPVASHDSRMLNRAPT